MMAVMCDRMQGPTHYIISTSSDDHGDAVRDEAVARRNFERLAATGHFVRLILVDGGKATELDRHNGDHSMLW